MIAGLMTSVRIVVPRSGSSALGGSANDAGFGYGRCYARHNSGWDACPVLTPGVPRGTDREEDAIPLIACTLPADRPGPGTGRRCSKDLGRSAGSVREHAAQRRIVRWYVVSTAYPGPDARRSSVYRHRWCVSKEPGSTPPGSSAPSLMRAVPRVRSGSDREVSPD